MTVANGWCQGTKAGGDLKENTQNNYVDWKKILKDFLKVIYPHVFSRRGFPGGSVVKNPPAKVGDSSLNPGWGRSPGEGNGKWLQCPCRENPMDRGAWRATVHGEGNARRGRDLQKGLA